MYIHYSSRKTAEEPEMVLSPPASVLSAAELDLLLFTCGTKLYVRNRPSDGPAAAKPKRDKSHTRIKHTASMDRLNIQLVNPSVHVPITTFFLVEECHDLFNNSFGTLTVLNFYGTFH